MHMHILTWSHPPHAYGHFLCGHVQVGGPLSFPILCWYSTWFLLSTLLYYIVYTDQRRRRSQRIPPTSTPSTPSTSHTFHLPQRTPPISNPSSPSTLHTSQTSHSRRILGLDAEFIKICDGRRNKKGNFSRQHKVGHLAVVIVDSDNTSCTILFNKINC